MKKFILCLVAAFLLSSCTLVVRNYDVDISAQQHSTVSFHNTITATIDKDSEVVQETAIDVTKPRFGGVF